MAHFLQWTTITLVMMAVLLGQAPATCAQAVAKPLQVADCLRLMRADSAHLFFDDNFALTPPTCAAIRRECRMEAATGNFVGQVRDYRQSDNKLLYKATYASGVRNGRYEKYFTNQQIAVRGEYAQGKPSGIWQFWYEDGKPWQTLEWTGGQNPSLRVVNYWDANGAQQVVDGEGNWRGDIGGRFPMRYNGPIVHGYQQGEWESHSLKNNGLLTIEQFNEGKLRQGQQIVAQGLDVVGVPLPTQTMKYTSHASLALQVTDNSLSAEPLHLGQSCEQHAIAEKTTAVMLKALQNGKIHLEIAMPMPPQTPSAYLHALLSQVRDNAALAQALPPAKGSKVVIEADLDEQGRPYNIVSPTSELATFLATVLPGLGAWSPAVANGQPIPGKLKIEFRKQRKQWQCTIRADVPAPIMGEMLVPGRVYDSERLN